MSTKASSSRALCVLLLLVAAVLVALASTAQAFVAPIPGTARVQAVAAARSRGRPLGLRMMAVEPVGAASWVAGASTSVLVAASQLVKDVPKTLIDMSEAAASASAEAAAPYTNADGTFTNAAEVIEDVSARVGPDLPPPYYAVVFALALLVVSGLQQLSLGNVFDDEAKSAGSGGAVARRMNMRERSFFKKK